MDIQLPPIDPKNPPNVRELYQCTDLGENANKFWLVEFWDKGGIMRVYYGRVGTKPQTKEWTGKTRAYVQNEIYKKTEARRGTRDEYTKVILQEAGQSITTSKSALVKPAGRTGEIIDYIFREANEKIATYLATGINALSIEAIRAANTLLDEIARAQAFNIPELVERYYNLIPTILPRKINLDEVTAAFLKDLNEQHDRLQQLEAAVLTSAAQQMAPDQDQESLLGATLTRLDEKSETYAAIYTHLNKGLKHNYKVKVHDIFAVSNRKLTADFDKCAIGNIQMLYHGTSNANIRHILQTGLRLPKSSANGAMFGKGIYFASDASKSANYVYYTRGPSTPVGFLLVNAVKLGRTWSPRTSDSSISAETLKRHGADSVWAKGGDGMLRFDEFVIFNQCQHNLQFLITWEKW